MPGSISIFLIGDVIIKKELATSELIPFLKISGHANSKEKLQWTGNCESRRALCQAKEDGLKSLWLIPFSVSIETGNL